jgi:hypothetical protein
MELHSTPNAVEEAGAEVAFCVMKYYRATRSTFLQMTKQL